MATRTVEVFTAGCALCDEAVTLVQRVACPSCNVKVHDLNTKEGLAKAKQYGVSRAPAVVVDGAVAACCNHRGLDEATLRGLGLGAPG